MANKGLLYAHLKRFVRHRLGAIVVERKNEKEVADPCPVRTVLWFVSCDLQTGRRPCFNFAFPSTCTWVELAGLWQGRKIMFNFIHSLKHLPRFEGKT